MMTLEEAEALAVNLQTEMAPYVEQMCIAGSIRRQKPDGIKDIEIVAVPKWAPSRVGNLLGETQLLNQLLVWAFDAEARGDIQWIKPGTSEIIPWEPKRTGRYWRGLLPCGVKLDMFMTTRESFGLILLIRTGSAEFSQAVVTHARRIGWRSIIGQLLSPQGEVIPTPEESDVFEALGLCHIPPWERTGAEAVRQK